MAKPYFDVGNNYYWGKKKIQIMDWMPDGGTFLYLVGYNRWNGGWEWTEEWISENQISEYGARRKSSRKMSRKKSRSKSRITRKRKTRKRKTRKRKTRRKVNNYL